MKRIDSKIVSKSGLSAHAESTPAAGTGLDAHRNDVPGTTLAPGAGPLQRRPDRSRRFAVEPLEPRALLNTAWGTVTPTEAQVVTPIVSSATAPTASFFQSSDLWKSIGYTVDNNTNNSQTAAPTTTSDSNASASSSTPAPAPANAGSSETPANPTTPSEQTSPVVTPTPTVANTATTPETASTATPPATTETPSASTPTSTTTPTPTTTTPTATTTTPTATTTTPTATATTTTATTPTATTPTATTPTTTTPTTTTPTATTPTGASTTNSNSSASTPTSTATPLVPGDPQPASADGTLAPTSTSNSSTTTPAATTTATATATPTAEAAATATATPTVPTVTVPTTAPTAGTPVFTAVADRTVPEGTLLSFMASATDSDNGQSLIYSLPPGSPAGASVDPLTGVFQYAPADGPMTQSFTLLATDNGSPAKTGVEPFQVQVTNVPPTIRMGADATIVANAGLNRLGSISDPGLDAVTAKVDYGDGKGVQDLPLISNTSFRLTGKYAVPGTYPITVTATDEDGGVSKSTINVKVIASQTTAPVAPTSTTNTNTNTNTSTNPVVGLTVTPPKVESIALGQKVTGKNRVGAVKVVFDRTVNVGPATFELRDRRRRAIDLHVDLALEDGNTVATLTAAGRLGLMSGGAPTLTIHSSGVIDSNGQNLDGNNDLAPGGDVVQTLRNTANRRGPARLV